MKKLLLDVQMVQFSKFPATSIIVFACPLLINDSLLLLAIILVL